MNKEEFEALEVRPKNSGWYQVTLYQFANVLEGDKEYIQDQIIFNGKTWEYDEYKDCYVCFIHKLTATITQ